MPLAMILRARGVSVAGSDRSLDQGRVPAKFDALRALGIDLYPQDGSGVTDANLLVVASAAVEESVPDIAAANRLGCPRATRAELLAGLFNAATLPIGVAGTSGKSTVTGMIGWIMHATGRDPTVMNGAVMKNFVRDDAPFASALVGTGPAFVSEVDESDGSIALYAPRIAVLNNVSLDHKGLDELRLLFGGFLDKSRVAVVNADDADAAALGAALPEGRVTSFSVEGAADLVARNLREEPFGVRFDLEAGHLAVSVAIKVPGRHNVSNALAAIGAALAAGVALSDAAEAIGGFTGLRRRMELVGEMGGVAVIDDFGHNPDKIAATLDTLHAFAGRLLLLFQPHGYGPLKVMGRELVATFAEKMRGGDMLVMPDPVYQGGTVAREVGSGDIVRGVVEAGRDARYVADRAEAAAMLVEAARAGDRIVVMGARDDTLSLLAQGMLRDLGARQASLTAGGVKRAI